MDIKAEKRPQIALLGQYGGINLGDGAIWESMLAAIRNRIPNADIVGFTCNPAETTARHGIASYSLRWDSSSSRVDASSDTQSPDCEQKQDHIRNNVSLRNKLSDLLPALRRRYWNFQHILLNNKQTKNNGTLLADVDLIIVVGSGQFSSLFGGPYTHPLALQKWALMAKRAAVEFVMLSVGAAKLEFPSRSFVRRAISLANYTSFRDEISKQHVGGSAANTAQVVPDLAYAFPLQQQIRPISLPPDGAVVGISPMAYADPRFYPEPDVLAFTKHIKSLAEISCQLLEQGNHVVLFTSDEPDKLAQNELAELIQKRVSLDLWKRVTLTDASTVGGLVDAISQVDVVVAARLHGVLMSHVIGRPTLAIAHDRKVTTLMDELGHGEYCQPIDTFDVELGLKQLGEILARRESIARDIRNQNTKYRRRVEAQYDRVFARFQE